MHTVLVSFVAASSIGSLVWGATYWGNGSYMFIQFFLPLLWAISSVTLLMRWGPKRRWAPRLIVALSAVPALYYPGEIIAMSLFFAIQGFV